MKKRFIKKQVWLFVLLMSFIFVFSGVQPKFEISDNRFTFTSVEFKDFSNYLLETLYFTPEKLIELQIPVRHPSAQDFLDTYCKYMFDGTLSKHQFAECSGEVPSYFQDKTLLSNPENLKIVQKICQNYPKSSLCDSERVNFRNLDEGQFLQQPNPDDSPTRDQIMGREITCMIEERLCHVDCRSDLSNPPSEIEEKACKDKCDEDYRCCMDAVSVYANGEQAKYHGQMVIVDDCSEGFECYYPNVCIGEIGRESCYVRNRPISQGHKAACCISGCVDPKTNCDERGGNYCTSCGLGEILEEYPRNPLLNSYCCAGPCFSIDPSGGGPPPDENYRFIIEVCDSDESGGVFPSPPESQLMLGPGPGSKPPAGGGDGGDGDSGDDGGDGGDGTGDGILCLIKICEHF